MNILLNATFPVSIEKYGRIVREFAAKSAIRPLSPKWVSRVLGQPQTGIAPDEIDTNNYVHDIAALTIVAKCWHCDNVNAKNTAIMLLRRYSDLAAVDLESAIRSDDNYGARICYLENYKSAMEEFVQRCDFSHCNLSGLNLSQLNFSGTTLIGTYFHDALLQGCDFSGAILRNAEFTGADLRQVCNVDYDANDIRETRRSGLERSKWEELKREYTKYRVFLHAALLVLAILPNAVQGVYLLFVAKLEEKLVVEQLASVEYAVDHAKRLVEVVYGADSRELEAFSTSANDYIQRIKNGPRGRILELLFQVPAEWDLALRHVDQRLRTTAGVILNIIMISLFVVQFMRWRITAYIYDLDRDEDCSGITPRYMITRGGRADRRRVRKFVAVTVQNCRMLLGQVADGYFEVYVLHRVLIRPARIVGSIFVVANLALWLLTPRML